MKIYEDKFPMGTYKKQRTAGIYIHQMLYDNLKVLGDAIVNDNSFLLLVSSQALSVRTGKSTFVQNLGEAWNHIMDKSHGIKLPTLSMKNIVFNTDDMQKRAFDLPKYSPLILDESDDLTGHAMSKEIQGINRFMRKCGQLNLFIIMILPDFFEFPKGIAVNRSVALVTVDYGDNFSRGHFKFYNFKAKKDLYIKGKKFNDYSVHPETFHGDFAPYYIVNEDDYRKEKYKDLIDDTDDRKNSFQKDVEKQFGRELFIKVMTDYRKDRKNITAERICGWFDMSDETGRKIMDEYIKQMDKKNTAQPSSLPIPNPILYIKAPMDEEKEGAEPK